MKSRDLPYVEIPPDPVIEAYKKDVDRTLLRRNPGSAEEILRGLTKMVADLQELRRATVLAEAKKRLSETGRL